GHEDAIKDYISRKYERTDKRRFLSHNGFSYLVNIPTVLRAGDPLNMKHPMELTGGSGSIAPFRGKAPNDESYATQDFIITVLESSCDLFQPNPPTPTPIPTPTPTPVFFPNPPPRKKMDECCRDSVKLLRQIHKRLGISKFPGQLPVTIIQEVTKKGEKPAEPAQEPIADFVDLLTWIFKRDDERWGQWEIAIDIKDTDITKEGEQGKTIRFPNLAESIAELEGQILSILTNVEALVALQVKTLAESGIGRQEAMKGYLASKAIIKYLAIKTVEKDFPHPLTYTPGAESIDKLIQESEGHLVGIDYE
ncbi:MULTISPECIES: hypothetical protein, partial [unclassified Microcoleus]|uniref:hypothetical protein n=1 Tax=unclassified Microcoleus TaxID=2642155 RepID=UPI002FD476A6